MNKKIENGLYRVGEIAGAVLILGILAALLLVDKRFDYVYKVPCLLPNLAFAGLFVLTLGGLYLWMKRSPRMINRMIDGVDMSAKGIFVVASILFLLQVYISYQIFFKTGWDCLELVEMAKGIVNGGQYMDNDAYFSMYPNNVLLVGFFAIIMKTTSFLGEQGQYFSLIAVGCLLVNISGILMSDCVRLLTKKRTYAIGSWAVFVLLAGLSPWITIPYSDTYSIIFPILAFWLYIHKNEKNQYGIWLAIGLLCLIGGRIKPTVFLIWFVMIGLEIWHFLFHIFKEKGKWKQAVGFLTTILLASLLVFGMDRLVDKGLGADLIEQKEFSLTHYLMMGLNEKSGGTYDQWDVNFTASFGTKEERSQQNLIVVKQRLEQMGVPGFAKHVLKKTLTNFNDGTFAWGKEGAFYYTFYERNGWPATFLRSLYYEDGKLYPVFQLLAQAGWICTLLSITGFLVKKKEETKNRDAEFVMVISVVAIALFVTVFEARGRYLLIYVPIFVVCGAAGLKRILETLAKKCNTLYNQ